MLRSIEAIIQMLDADYIEYKDMSRKVSGVCIDSANARQEIFIFLLSGNVSTAMILRRRQ